jgi:endonuclease/exonuclease/phosphatase (EEP) superfamily protein YafD
MRTKARHFRKSGYRTFRLGDLNRRPGYWPQIIKRSIGIGYDRIIHPLSVVLLRSWRGDREGSDHRPLIGQYRITR